MSSSIWKSLFCAVGLLVLFYPLLAWKADIRTTIVSEADPIAALVEICDEEISPPPAAPATKKAKTVKAVKKLPARKAKKAKSTTVNRPLPATAILFPVDGFGLEAIISIYGDARAGGKRSHEGVDIMAPRGTPVVASQDGTVVKVKNSGSGGKQVWLETADGLTFFYAHLDSWSVAVNDKVKQGDVLGTVGNTGNASHTLPHLHFGIYTGRRSTTDPLPYLKPVGTAG